MPEEVGLDCQGGVILVNSFGVVTEEDLDKTFNTVLEFINQKGFTKIMVDTTRQIKLPETTPLFSFAEKLSDKTKSVKHALVIGERTMGENSFIETVAQNRGLMIKSFSSIKAALAWLNGNEVNN